MAGPIEDIHDAALHGSLAIDVLLRKVKATVTVHDLDNIDWLEKELNGYESSDVPEYRIVRGTLVVWNPFRGWTPTCGDPGIISKLDQAWLRMSVATLRSLLDDKKLSYLDFPHSPESVARINRHMSPPSAQVVVRVGRAHLENVINRVRSKVLDWSISMIKNMPDQLKVKGDTMSDNDSDKSSGGIINIGSIVGNIGSIGAGSVSSGIVSSSSVEKIKIALDRVDKVSQLLVFEGVDEMSFTDSMGRLRKEISSDSPDSSRVKAFINDVRSSLVGASGNIISEGVLSVLKDALKSIS